jgi:hypothetical protein
MTQLYGKGIWLRYSADIDLAIGMAGKTGGTHILGKTGHRTMFFPGSAQRVYNRVRETRLIPFAWLPITCDAPEGEARVAVKTAAIGYESIVFVVGDQAAGQQANATELGQRLRDAGINPARLYYAGPPVGSRYPNIPYAEMNEFCQGGFMPQSTPALLKPAEVVIHKMTYEQHIQWSEAEGISTPIYPILAGYRDEGITDRLTTEEFAHWVDVLAEHEPTFFSIFHAAVTDPDLWPSLAKAAVPQSPGADSAEPLLLPKPTIPPLDIVEEEPVPTKPRPVKEARQPSPPPEFVEVEGAAYITVQPDDTIANLCQKHGCTWEQFWQWNQHLWDMRALSRDPDYMQAGWRVRVG